MSKSGLKPCNFCKQKVDIRYRIQYNQSGIWVLVCPKCWRTVSQNNSDYRYGGTWKSRR